MSHEEFLTLLDGVMARLAVSDVHTLSLEADDISLRVEWGHPAAALPLPPASAATIAAAPALAVPSAPAGHGFQVKSPMVGTFYAASAPDAPPFVTVGSRVSKGDTLCILEAMKMMNEIESERDGVITRVLMQNGDLAEYGQVLFEMEAAE